jgi:hypothetical protein
MKISQNISLTLRSFSVIAQILRTRSKKYFYENKKRVLFPCGVNPERIMSFMCQHQVHRIYVNSWRRNVHDLRDSCGFAATYTSHP